MHHLAAGRVPGKGHLSLQSTSGSGHLCFVNPTQVVQEGMTGYFGSLQARQQAWICPHGSSFQQGQGPLCLRYALY